MRHYIDDAKMARCRSPFFNASSILGGYGVDFECAIPKLLVQMGLAVVEPVETTADHLTQQPSDSLHEFYLQTAYSDLFAQVQRTEAFRLLQKHARYAQGQQYKPDFPDY